jgi:hypothetical protein
VLPLVETTVLPETIVTGSEAAAGAGAKPEAEGGALPPLALAIELSLEGEAADEPDAPPDVSDVSEEAEPKAG